MKVLFVSHYEKINGAPKSMLSLICELKKQGVRFLVTLPNHGPMEDELKRLEIEYCIVKSRECFYREGDRKRKILRWFNEIYNVKSVCQMMRVIKEFNPDIVHSNSYAIDVGALAAFLTNKPHIWHFREFMKADFGFVHNIERKAIWLTKKSAKIIAVSEAVKEYYIQRTKAENIEVIYNGIDKEIYRIDKKLHLESEKLKFLIAGAVLDGKGQREAIEACRILHKRGYSNFQLNIVGAISREDMRSLKRIRNRNLLNKYIKIHGFQEDMIAVRQGMDVELVCSVCEAFGRVTIEAMLADMLVIGANTGGTKELVQDGVNGILYQQGNAVDLADKIESVLNNPQQYVQCIRKGKEEALEKFTVGDMSEKVVHIYQEII